MSTIDPALSTDERDPIPLPRDWSAQLRARGRTMTWLARELGMSRTYLADVAAGRKSPSPRLAERITTLLEADAVWDPRLERVRAIASDRARWRDVEDQARRLADAIARALEG